MTIKEGILRRERQIRAATRSIPGRVLVALDQSENSMAAWRQAQVLAKCWDAEVRGLYVQRWIFGLGEFGLADPTATARSSEKVVAALHRKLGLRADMSILPGDAVEGIVQWAQANRSDLVVMGTHGRTGLARALRGSVAEAVVRRSLVPILIVKGLSRPIRSIVAPFDFKPQSRAGLRYAAAYAKSLGAKLTLLHVAAPPGAAASRSSIAGLRRLAASELKPFNVEEPQIRVAVGDPVKEIIETSPSCDLVVLTARSRGLLEDFVLGTTTERVLRYSACPVLAVPSQEK